MGLASAAGCGGSSTKAAPSVTAVAPVTSPKAVTTLGPAVIATTAEVIGQHYDEAVAAATGFKSAIDSFLSSPTDATLAAARTSWTQARVPYVRTEAYRFSNGPIDSGDNVEGFINAWPLDEAYVDVLIAAPDPITPESLRAANERGGERNISTGWHAIEYLLWGVDNSPTGPGDRPASDFDPAAEATKRRREYLRVTTDMLVADLTSVAAEWKADGPYRSSFVKIEQREALRRLMTGLGTLSGGELFGQRIAVPFETKDKEEEHSCFSDTTTQDMQSDVEGIRRTYLGIGVNGQPVGPSLSDLVKSVDPALDERVRSAVDAAVAAVGQIPSPFDQAFLGADTAPGRVAIQAALNAIQTQTEAFVAASEALGLQIATEVP
jgi:putative iron-regulated protein